jgi:ATP-binding cassette subfamily B protein/subfamily B ATP-binding cassette protein MsbA
VAGASLKSLAKDDRPRSTREVVLRLWRYLWPYKTDVIGGGIWVILASVASAVTPALTGLIINLATAAAKVHGSANVLIVPGALLVAASVFGWLAQRQQILMLGTAGQKAVYDLRTAVFSAISRLDVAYFESVESGDLMSRLINDVNQVDSFLSQGFRRLLGAVVGLVATLAAMLWVDWRLALTTLIVIPVMLVVTRLFGFLARGAFRTRQEAIGDVSATLAEEIGGIKVAQAFNRTDRNRSQFSQRNAANRDANVSAAVVSSAFSPVLGVISALSTAIVAAVGGYLASKQVVSLGVVVAFFAYARQFFNSVSQMSSLYSDAQSALAGGERVFSVLDTPSEVADEPGATALPRAVGKVEFRDVRFAYSTGRDILHGIDIVVEAGTTLAIVGPTGAGKTTLMNLAPRFYDATGGSVLIDGIDVKTLQLASLRRNFGIVLQDPFLFSGTIADNIRYGCLNATDEELLRAADVAGAAAFIAGLPQGLETAVNERGTTLSTGQRQLVAFARAIVGDPAILILDEATSSVDTRTEMLIQSGLRNILADRTSLIIAHRLSTVRDADTIVVLEAGRVVERGSYAELMAREGAFWRLHAAQFSTE